MKYRAEIDGLRAIAVLSVVLTHAGFPWLPGGFAGVDIFFVISGYLITRILTGEMGEERFSLGRYYARRARRILPALVVMVLICLPFAWWLMLPSELEEFARSVMAVALFLSNVEFWRQSGYFAGDAAFKPLLHTWSLGVEEQFYLVFPLILLALRRLRMVWVLVVLAAVSLIASEWGWRNVPDANFYLFPFRAWQLLAGGLAALAGDKLGQRPNNLLSVAGLMMIAYSLLVFNETTPFPSVYALLPTGGSVLILLYGGAGSAVGRILSVRAMVAVGLISYSVYLWHQPLFAFARIWNVFEPPPGVMAALTFASLGLGWVSWHYVELPFRRRPVLFILGQGRLLCLSGISLLVLLVLGAGMRQAEEAGLRPSHWNGISPQEREALLQGRFAGIRVGTCHYNRDVRRGLDKFLRDWTCFSNDEPDLIPVAAGVFGDSHAADKAAAIRAAGFDVLQMTGAGCPLIIVSRIRPECKLLRDAFDTRMKNAGITTVFIANEMTGAELAPAYLQEVIDHWTAHYDKVFLFAPMPFFSRFEEIQQLQGAEDRQRLRPDLSLVSTFRASVARVDLKGATVIDSFSLFCPEPATCAPDDGEILLIDSGHLSAHGALVFGNRLVVQPGLPFVAVAH